ncbi:MAG: Gfo/Idh/MocA family oxidoreductase [Euryarchaeota archaeon]|nr:Gfo/Idh/MocA family oxidoreductase [Euryarchaeota archaeon]
MNVIVIGYGSIGKRHVDNLLKLRQIGQVIVCSNHLDSFQNHPEKEKLKLVRSLEELSPMISSGRQFDFAIIANETYKHVETANTIAESGIHLFIEKPISDSVTKAISLKKIAEKSNIKIFVAYNFRFLGAIQYVKNQISSGVIGSLYFAEIEVGQYLPSWRPLSDYRESYSARKEQGGGAALDLSHEIDYMRYLFGDPVSWKSMKSKVSDLDINSEDIFKGIYQFSSGFLCSVHTDYIRHNKKRGINIVGSKGTLECDFIKKYIKMQTNSGEISLLEDVHLFDVDESYKSELNHFIECIEKDKKPQITLDDGIEVLNLIEGDHV